MEVKKELTLNEYQKKAMSTCMDSSNNFSYMMLNLVGEIGEVASKVAKHIRKENMMIEENILYRRNHTDKEIFDDIKAEAGDIIWQIAGLCHVMGWSFEEVAQQNLDKLASRKERNVIDGNGDNR